MKWIYADPSKSGPYLCAVSGKNNCAWIVLDNNYIWWNYCDNCGYWYLEENM